MLREELVARIALGLAIAGILVLFLIDFTYEAREVKISEISEDNIGERVIVCGRIDGSYLVKGVLIFTINDGVKIKGVAFNPGREAFQFLKKNSFAKVEGKVELYKGELEIVAERVEKC